MRHRIFYALVGAFIFVAGVDVGIFICFEQDLQAAAR